jgi:hypothetical protein
MEERVGAKVADMRAKAAPVLPAQSANALAPQEARG